MPDRPATANIDIDPELIPGAHNAVSVCLQLTPEERVTIITDEVTCDIAAALQSRSRGDWLGTRGLRSRRLCCASADRDAGNHSRDLAHSQVSIFCAQTQPGELALAHEMTT